MTSSTDSGLDPAVRARLERLAAPAAPKRAVRAADGLPAQRIDADPRRAPLASDAGTAPRAVEAALDAEDGTPAVAQGLRGRLTGTLTLTKRHAWALALLVLVGVAASSGLTLRARAVEVGSPVSSGSVSAMPRSLPPEATPTASPSPTATVTVHVLGAVVRPGVVTIPGPARVRDVIAAAGGLRPDADPGELNLAALISDGAQVMVGTVGQPRGEVRGGAGSAAVGGNPSGSADAKLDLNAATLDQLDQLPGVGPVTAQAILAWRTKHGRFTAVEELQEVDGIGPKTYAQIAPHVRV